MRLQLHPGIPDDGLYDDQRRYSAGHPSALGETFLMPLPRSWGYADPEVAERAVRRANGELIRCAVCAAQGFYREFLIGEEAHDETHDAANAAFRDALRSADWRDIDCRACGKTILRVNAAAQDWGDEDEYECAGCSGMGKPVVAAMRDRLL